MRTRSTGRHRERDDHKVAHVGDLHCHEMFPGTFHGHVGVSKLVEGGEVGVLEEAGCRADQRDQKLQSNSSDVGDVEVVRTMHLVAFEESKGARKLEEVTHWWIGWDKLPTLASHDDESDTETLGVAGGKESREETRDGSKTNVVLG